MTSREFRSVAFRITARIQRRLIHFITKGRAGISLTNSEYPLDLKYSFSAIVQNGSIFKEINPRTNIADSHYFKPRHIIEVEDVIIDSQTGIVFTKAGNFITESSFWPQLWLRNNFIPKPVAPFTMESNNYYVLMPSNGFYHSLIEDIPMVLRQISQKESSMLLVYESAPRYILDLAQLLGHNIVRAPRYVRFQKFSFLQRNSDVGWPHPEDIDLLRSYFLKAQMKFNLQHPAKPKVYVSRLNSSRSPRFEARLIKELVKRGWEIIFSEKLSMSDQIEIFSGASWIAGVHGAGLSSMVWMNKGSRVTELGPTRFVPCYSRLASILSHEYQRIEFTDSDASLGEILSVLN